MAKSDLRNFPTGIGPVRRLFVAQRPITTTGTGALGAPAASQDAPLAGRALLPVLRYQMRALYFELGAKAGTTATTMGLTARRITTTANSTSMTFTATAISTGFGFLAHIVASKCWKHKLAASGGTDITLAPALRITFSSGGNVFSQVTNDPQVPSTRRGYLPGLLASAQSRYVANWAVIVDGMMDDL